LSLTYRVVRSLRSDVAVLRNADACQFDWV
jgi:hypothetical protein